MHRSGSTDGARRNRRGGGESSGEQPLIYRGRVFTIFKFALFSSFAQFLGVCVAASCKSEGSSFRAAARNASFSAGGACSSSCFTGTRACSFFKGGTSELKYSRNALIWFSWANRWFSFWTRYAAHPDRPDFPERLFFWPPLWQPVSSKLEPACSGKYEVAHANSTSISPSRAWQSSVHTHSLAVRKEACVFRVVYVGIFFARRSPSKGLSQH